MNQQAPGAGRMALRSTTQLGSHLLFGAKAARDFGRTALGGTWASASLGIVVETGLSIYDYGGVAAFREPAFYERVVGGITATTVGGVVGVLVTAATIETGPWAFVIGGVAGIAAGSVARIGGAAATHVVIDMVSPEMLQTREREQLDRVAAALDRRIAELSVWPTEGTGGRPDGS